MPYKPEYRVRNVTLADIGSIMRMENEGFALQTRETEATFVRRMAIFSDGFFLLEIQDLDGWIPVGYLCSEIWNEIPKDTVSAFARDHDIATLHRADGNSLYIASMTVLPAHHGFRFGSILFKASIKTVCSQYKTINNLVLIVNESWRAARHIYQADGFKETGTIPGYFVATSTQGSTAIVMQRSVDR
jgi:ribosomal protein S18 acetylase RimI-like enzyme